MGDPGKNFDIGRRTFLKGAAGSSALGFGLQGVAGRASAATADPVIVEQGDRSYLVDPLSNGETVESFYGYSDGGSDLGFERSDASQFFAWDGPEGTSLGVVHDAADGSGGVASVRFAGLPGGEWVVQDDPSDFDDAADRNPTWRWFGDKVDGGAFRDLGEDFAVTVDPDYGEWIDDLYFLEGTGGGDREISSTPFGIENDYSSESKTTDWTTVEADLSEFAGGEATLVLACDGRWTYEFENTLSWIEADYLTIPGVLDEDFSDLSGWTCENDPRDDGYSDTPTKGFCRVDDGVVRVQEETNRMRYLVRTVDLPAEDDLTLEALVRAHISAAWSNARLRVRATRGGVTDPERVALFPGQAFTVRRGDPPAVQQLAADKQLKIDRIQNLAGTTLGRDEAENEVDQRAQALLSEVDRRWDDADAAETDQLVEALERMNATEAVTEQSTETVVGDLSPTETNLENLWSLTFGLATKKIGGRYGGITGEVVTKIVEEFVGILGGMADSFLGEGQVAGGVLDDVTDEVENLKDEHGDVFEDYLDRDLATDIAESATEGEGAIADAASGLVDRLDDNRTLLELIEELYFRGYYFEEDWPAVEIPTPEEIELPELEYRWDVPDEDLPGFLRAIYPEELDVIEYEFDPGEFDLPATDFLEDLSAVTEDVTDFATVGGIDETVDDRMAAIDALLGDLDEQDDETRAAVEAALTRGIGGVGGFAREFIYRIEQFDQLFGGASSLAREIALWSFVVAALVTLLSSGLLGAIAVTALVNIIAGLLAVMTVIGGVQLILNAVQVAVGQGYLSLNTNAHHVGTYALAETDLGGVDL